MNVWDHLGELRRRLLVCIYALIGGMAVGVFAVNPVISWLARPVGELVFLEPTEAFAAQVKVAVGVSFLLVLPLILYQAWAFLGAALRDAERRYLRWAIPFCYGLFLLGTAFATFVVFPKAVGFLLTLKSPHLRPMLSVEAYLNFYILLALAFGTLFQLPLAMHFLAKLGMLRPEFLEGNRRICYVGIFVMATLFNPVPEVFTQLLLAFAAIALFESSVFLVRWEAKRQRRMDGPVQNQLKEGAK